MLVNSDKERSLIADLSAANDYDHEHFKSAEIQVRLLSSAYLIFRNSSRALTSFTVLDSS